MKKPNEGKKNYTLDDLIKMGKITSKTIDVLILSNHILKKNIVSESRRMMKKIKVSNKPIIKLNI